ncbi:MAG TPA: hypothetical protein VMS55_20360 [Myxococcota bacterium]|nr:hypothetical protein [Myxococcota bacterium]
MNFVPHTKRLGGLPRRFARSLDARIVFLHVPKCGGNSVRLALRDAYRGPFSGGSRHRMHVGPEASRRAAESLGVPVDAFRDALLRYHLAESKRRLFTGHFAWPEGLLEEFPDVSLVTLLRDPVAHFLSCYYEARERGRTGDSLDAFLDGPHARRIGARFVQAFAGSPARDLESDAAQQAARERLASVTVLGLLEDLPGFVADFRQRFGVRLRLPHANAGRLRQQAARDELTDSLRARIEERVAPNQALYDFATLEIARRRDAATTSKGDPC